MEENKNVISEETLSEEQVTVPAETKVEETVSQEELHGENLNDRVKVLSPMMTVLKRFFRSKLSVIGLVMLLVLFLFSFVGPLFSPWFENGNVVIDYALGKEYLTTANKIQYEIDGQLYTAFDLAAKNYDRNIYANITWQHWLGTDENGYDLLTRLMLGGRISLTIGFVVVIIETVIGVVLGGLAGYFGGWVDQVIMRIVDILNCIPTLPIMLILAATLDGLGIMDISRLYYLMIVLCLIGWAGTARIVRGQILSLREQEFMLAAKASGLSVGRKIFKHLIPNVMPQLIVSMTLGLGSIILTEATLGFLSLGAPLGTSTWGGLINYVNNYMDTPYINFWIPAGICITLAILAFNFVGDGLRDAFDPKMKR